MSSGDRCEVCARIHSALDAEPGGGAVLLVGSLGMFGFLNGASGAVRESYARSFADGTIGQGDAKCGVIEAFAHTAKCGFDGRGIRTLSNEFVTAAVKHSALAKFFVEQRSNGADGFIARTVIQLVVDALEIVEVEEGLNGLQPSSIRLVGICGEIANARHRAATYFPGHAILFQQRHVFVTFNRREFGTARAKVRQPGSGIRNGSPN